MKKLSLHMVVAFSLCPGAHEARIVETPHDLKQSVQELISDNKSSQPIAQIGEEILSDLKESQDNWTRNEELQKDIREFSLQITDLRRKNSWAKFSVEEGLATLLRKYPSPESRRDAGQAYLTELNSVLATTVVGSKVLRCYDEAAGPEIVGDKVIFRDRVSAEEWGDPSITMAFTVEYASPQDTEHFIKVLKFDPDLDPIQALVVYTHELQHGCRTRENIEDLMRIDRLRTQQFAANLGGFFGGGNPTTASAPNAALVNEIQDAERILSQHRVIDEVRAYTITYEIFNELAARAPEWTCGVTYLSTFFGLQPLPLSEYCGTIEKMIKDGSFTAYLIDQYMEFGLYEWSHFYEGDGKTEPRVIRKDFLERLSSELIPL